MKMKWIKGIFLVLITGLVFASCSKESNPEEDILGTWTVEDVDFEASIGTKSLLQYYMDEFGMTEPQAQAVMAVFDAALAEQFDGSIEIKADKTYIATLGGESDAGTWSLSSDYETLALDSDADETVVLDIISLSSSKAVMEMSQAISEDLNDDDVPEDISITVEMSLEKQ